MIDPLFHPRLHNISREEAGLSALMVLRWRTIVHFGGCNKLTPLNGLRTCPTSLSSKHQPHCNDLMSLVYIYKEKVSKRWPFFSNINALKRTHKEMSTLLPVRSVFIVIFTGEWKLRNVSRYINVGFYSTRLLLWSPCNRVKQRLLAIPTRVHNDWIWNKCSSYVKLPISIHRWYRDSSGTW